MVTQCSSSSNQLILEQAYLDRIWSNQCGKDNALQVIIHREDRGLFLGTVMAGCSGHEIVLWAAELTDGRWDKKARGVQVRGSLDNLGGW